MISVAKADVSDVSSWGSTDMFSLLFTTIKNQFKEIFYFHASTEWGIGIPAVLNSGSYYGETIFTAVKGEVAGWTI